MKKYDSYKSCDIHVGDNIFSQMFETSWTFSEIKSWMLDTYAIDESAIVKIEFSSVTVYKHSKS